MSIPYDQLVRINKLFGSWSDCKFKIDNNQFVGFTEIDFKEKREHEKVYLADQSGTPAGMTDGKYDLESFSFTCLTATWERITTYLANKPGIGGRSFGDARFTFLAQISNLRLGAPILTFQINTCQIASSAPAFKNDQGALLTPVTVDALSMTTNNRQLFKDSLLAA